MSRGSPLSPGESPGTANAVRPLAPRGGGAAREHRVDVGVGRVGDPQLLAAQAVSAVAVGLRPQRQRRRVRARVGLGQRERRHRRARGHPRESIAALQPTPIRPGRSGRRRGPGARTRSRPRCSRGPAPRGSGTARSRSRDRARTAAPAARARASAATSGRLTRPGSPAAAIGASVSVASAHVPLVEVALVAIEMQVERGGHPSRGGTTATPISSTLAAGSNSSVTPNSPIAG